jgi:hypothetical protein
MRLALVRQRYSAYGGAERFIERALGALGKQGVAVTVLAREWIGDPGNVVRCDPFYLGRMWRDWSFARAVCREIARRPFDFVQSHEASPVATFTARATGARAMFTTAGRSSVSSPARSDSIPPSSFSPRRRCSQARACVR